MISRSALALALFLAIGIADSTDPQRSQSSQPSWHQFSSNVNYRITAIIDVNGGADTGPNFESFTGQGKNQPLQLQDEDESKAKSMTSMGYSVPIDVITLFDTGTNTYRQRISYYGGTQIDYNNNGKGYKVISTPMVGKDEDISFPENSDSSCLFTGGKHHGKEKVGYLNFFPTVEQMEHYTLGNLVTNEAGIPYRIATLQAPHGSLNATSQTSAWFQPDASYDDPHNTGMPTNDWLQFRYTESTRTTIARPIKWTMLARNQIINAHTENWVVRYLSYEVIDGKEEREVYEGWFDAKFGRDCGDGEQQTDQFSLADDGRSNLQHNRLGMFFSTSTTSGNVLEEDELSVSSSSSSSSPQAKDPSHFDIFLARHNKQHDDVHEYTKRKAIHDANTANIERWNEEHAGKTRFASNEFLDLEVKEVMQFRGGHVPRGSRKVGRGASNDERRRNLRSATLDNESASERDEYSFATHPMSKDFDINTLPESFDWRQQLPGSVGPVKDQGFCGSCWAFSFISALESHWYIAHNQSVNLPEQFVNDCAWSDGANACDGGDSGAAAMDIISKFQGRVPTRDVYGGYLSVDGGCYVDILQDLGMLGDEGTKVSFANPSFTVQLTEWVEVPPRDDTAAKHALLTKGPLAIALNVVDAALYYADGVLDVASCEENDAEHLDHAINLVGWGVDELSDGSKAEHWILRNSWSALWGDAGYFKVRMGERDCGVTTNPGYPVVTKPDASGHGLVEPSSEKVASS